MRITFYTHTGEGFIPGREIVSGSVGEIQFEMHLEYYSIYIKQMLKKM